ncbi:MAG TPA: hypothetical protein VF041_00090 [Gemmatimonadaceae bacterium]
MKALVGTCLLLCTTIGTTTLSAQSDTARVGGFPYVAFGGREEVASWLVRYDRCAWVTSDSLLAQATDAERRRLGAEWFCYEEDGQWNAIYGKYDPAADRMDVVAHYQESPGSGFTRTAAPPPARALRIARALFTARGRLPAAVRTSGARFNTFVRQRQEGPEIWMLPGWQSNGVMVYGMELRYAFDSTGRTVRDSSVILAPLRATTPDTTRDLAIETDADEIPTVGQIFFMLAYHRYFHAIRVYTRGFVTQLYDRNGDVFWLHAARPVAGDRRS